VRMRHSLALARQDLRLLRRDPVFFAVFLFMPLVLIAFVKPLLRSTLAADGVSGATGAEHAVPGMAVLFALFLTGQIGWHFFREHGWNTWDRLRASPASPFEVVLGKALVPVAQLFGYMLFVFALAALLFEFDVRGGVVALVLVSASFATAVVALSLALVALCDTAMQLNAVTNLGTMLLAGVGGAVTPLGELPDWVEPLAHATPTYWAMRGFREVTLGDPSMAAVAGPVLALLAFAALFAAVAAARFRYEEPRTSWA
jgi:ABC-2 type transport system permease protein